MPRPDKIVRRQPGTYKYTMQQREAALLALVHNGGAIKATALELGMEYETLHSWCTTRYKARYHELREKHGPELEAKAVAGLQGFLVRAEEAKGKALDATVAQIDDGTIKDPAKALQHISVSQGISVQKILELTQRPTQIHEHRSMNEIVSRLKALGADIQGVATEIPDATVLPSKSTTVSAPVAELPLEATAPDGSRNDH